MLPIGLCTNGPSYGHNLIPLVPTVQGEVTGPSLCHKALAQAEGAYLLWQTPPGPEAAEISAGHTLHHLLQGLGRVEGLRHRTRLGPVSSLWLACSGCACDSMPGRRPVGGADYICGRVRYTRLRQHLTDGRFSAAVPISGISHSIARLALDLPLNLPLASSLAMRCAACLLICTSMCADRNQTRHRHAGASVKLI